MSQLSLLESVLDNGLKGKLDQNMSFKEALTRVFKGWWLILIFTLIFTGAFYKNTQGKDTYRGSITVGITFDNLYQEQNLKDTIDKNPSLFTTSTTSVSQYLFFRLSSVEIQDQIAKKAGITVSDLNYTLPFYKVIDQKAGFVTVSYDAESRDVIEKFLLAVKETYTYLISTELNNNQTNTYKIRPQENLSQSITTVQKPAQQKILPSVAGFVVGIIISLLWPTVINLINKSKKSKKD